MTNLRHVLLGLDGKDEFCVCLFSSPLSLERLTKWRELRQTRLS
jgi:hypothetical protein